MDKHKLWQKSYHSAGSRHKNMWPSEGVISFILNENLNQNATVLDVGCGWLNNFRFCKSLGLNVYGVDIFISDDFKKEFGTFLTEGSFLDIEYQRKFDIIIDRCSFQHFYEHELENALNKAYNLLNINGCFYSEFTYSGLNGMENVIIEREQLVKMISNIFDEVEINDLIRTANNGETVFKTVITKCRKYARL